MKKLKLDLDNLQVESFATSSRADGIATVHGHQDLLNPFAGNVEQPGGLEPVDGGSDSDASCWASCPTDGCGTCYKTCWHTCAASCPGTSGETSVEVR